MMRASFGLMFLLLQQTKARENNVCREFQQYWSKTDGCYYNPDQDSHIWDIVKRKGYDLQRHRATTEDGYLLSVFRIPRHGRKPIFLQHGIYSTAVVFASTMNTSLAYVLYEAGFDVWLGNFRGTKYANEHVKLNTSEEKYWDFSFHEMGFYDLKAQLDLVHKVTRKKIHYIGFSMGTTASYIYNILRPKEASAKLSLIVSLAPIAYMEDIPSLFSLVARFWPQIEPEITKTKHGIFVESTTASEMKLKDRCLSNPVTMTLCIYRISLMMGFDFDQISPETFPVTFMLTTGAISTKTLTHYSQFILKRRFQHFDYGPKKNKRVYGRSKAPLYHIKRLSVPIYLVHSKNDFVSTPMNVERFYNELPAKVKRNGRHLIPYSRFNHLDFIQAKDQKTLLYDHLVHFLKHLKLS